MQTLLVLGAGKEQIDGLKLLRQKNLRSIALDMNPDAPGKNYADEFYAISTRDIGAIIKFLETYSKKIDGVICFGVDVPHVVSAAAEFLNVKCIPRSVAENCVNKFAMKKILKDRGVNVPEFMEVRSVSDIKLFIEKVGYPVVLKPIDNNGSKGVLRMIQGIDIDWAFNYSKKFSFSGRVMTEKFLAGPQISTEGIMYENNFYVTGFADRNYAFLEKTAPFIIEDGGDIPTKLNSDQVEVINKEFEKGVRALGIDWGPGKGDMVLGEDGKAYIIEIAARLSGGNFCFDKVPLSTGVEIADILVDMCLNREIDIKRFVPTKNSATSQRYLYPQPGKIIAIEGVEDVKNIENIYKVEIWPKIGDNIQVFENHTPKSGFVISLAKTREDAIFYAEKGVKMINFKVE